MDKVISYFMESPEAIATLLVVVASSIVTAVWFGVELFTRHPIIVRLLENRSLVYVNHIFRSQDWANAYKRIATN
jgi:hypothetical protein